MYRFHLDIPLGEDQAEAIAAAKDLIDELINMSSIHLDTSAQVRLGNDGDRSPKNYLRINENGHATGGKQPLFE